MLTESQHAARRLGIGSSDIAALVGLHAYRTRMDVFNEKVFGSKKKQSAEMEFGNDLERAVIRYRARELGGNEMPDEDYARLFEDQVVAGRTIRDLAHPLALTTPDALLVLPSEDPLAGRLRIVEAKAVGAHEQHQWGDDDASAPAGYQMQCVWHMGVSGIHECDLVAMIAGRPPVTWTVAWNADLYEQLLEVAESFWTDHVLTREKPDPIDGSESSSEYLRQMFPAEKAPMRAASALEEQQAALYVAARDQEKQGKLAKDYAGNVLRELLGEAEGWRSSNGFKATWKKQADGTRVLRVTEPKAKGKGRP